MQCRCQHVDSPLCAGFSAKVRGAACSTLSRRSSLLRHLAIAGCNPKCVALCTAGQGRLAGLSPLRHGRVAALQAQAVARPGAQMRVTLPPTPSLVITFDEDDDGTVEEAEEGELPARHVLAKQAARPAPKQALPLSARGTAQGAAPGAKTGAGRPAGRGRIAAPVAAAPLAVPAANAGVGAAESARLRAQARSLDTCL